jgi:SPP1 family predicted phage head-tail adaptor
MKEDIITLIGSDVTYDNIGNPIKTPTSKEIYCVVESVTQSEFFQASQSVLKPQLKMIVCEFDYNGETLVKYNNKNYTVYRSYLRNDERIELYLTTKAGA